MLHESWREAFWTSVHTTLHIQVLKPDKEKGQNLLIGCLSEYNVDITTFNLWKKTSHVHAVMSEMTFRASLRPDVV